MIRDRKSLDCQRHPTATTSRTHLQLVGVRELHSIRLEVQGDARAPLDVARGVLPDCTSETGRRQQLVRELQRCKVMRVPRPADAGGSILQDCETTGNEAASVSGE